MRLIYAILIGFLGSQTIWGQTLYFPPTTGNTWQTQSPTELGWCNDQIDPLVNFLATTNTKAFMVLKDGKIVIEQYFGTFTQDSLWYWASAGKSMTAFLVGLAQQEGSLSINNPTSDYLGNGWTTCPPNKEALITVRNQLTMTTGLDDSVTNPDCTDPTCLQYLADAGTRWAYHNAPYTLLDGVITDATGLTINQYYNSRIKSQIGMNGLYLPLDYNNVLFTNARSMARFGLLMLNKGKWANNTLLTDTIYYHNMVNSSQTLNPAYGYLWWLNGKTSFMVPGFQFTFSGSLHPAAPTDMVSALGKNGQIINIVPSQNLVMIRMGNNPDNSLVPITYNNDIWTYLNQILCNQTCTFTPPITGSSPVCSSSTQNYSVPAIAGSTYVWTVTGGTIQSGQGTNQITVLWNNGVAGTVSVVQSVQ
jgi:CubicO group peptidase (beta-lactamase class C family)